LFCNSNPMVDITNNLSQVGSSILNNFNKIEGMVWWGLEVILTWSYCYMGELLSLSLSLSLFTCLTTSSNGLGLGNLVRAQRLLWIVEWVSRLFPSPCDRIEMHSFHPHREWIWNLIPIPCDRIGMQSFHPHREWKWNLPPNSQGLENHWANESSRWCGILC